MNERAEPRNRCWKLFHCPRIFPLQERNHAVNYKHANSCSISFLSRRSRHRQEDHEIQEIRSSFAGHGHPTLSRPTQSRVSRQQGRSVILHIIPTYIGSVVRSSDLQRYIIDLWHIDEVAIYSDIDLWHSAACALCGIV